jgi:hypothetical protein
VPAIQTPEDPLPAGATPLRDEKKYFALYIIRYHIHPDLKSGYLEEEYPLTLFQALNTRYEQQKAGVLPEALQIEHINDSRTSGSLGITIMKFIR